MTPPNDYIYQGSKHHISIPVICFIVNCQNLNNCICVSLLLINSKFENVYRLVQENVISRTENDSNHLTSNANPKFHCNWHNNTQVTYRLDQPFAPRFLSGSHWFLGICDSSWYESISLSRIPWNVRPCPGTEPTLHAEKTVRNRPSPTAVLLVTTITIKPISYSKSVRSSSLLRGFTVFTC